LFRRILDRSRSIRSRWRILSALALITLLAPGMKARVYRARETVADIPMPAVTSGVASPARLVQLPPGIPLSGEQAPEGWSHLVFKSIPKLTSGDLDTVSAQAFEIAQRIRPLMVAEVRRASDDPHAPFHLKRVGVGLCAPGKEVGSDVVVSTMSIVGTRGEWTTKQRLILASLSYESAKAKLAAATSTFALVRTPVIFLVDGRHRKLDLCYALRVEPRTGELTTIVWPDLGASPSAAPTPAVGRRLSAAVFDLPQDVHATRALGKIPIAWSFAIRGLPDGPDLTLPAGFLSQVASADGTAPNSASIEQALMSFDRRHGLSTGGVARAGQ
jgi:hypothetical protein